MDLSNTHLLVKYQDYLFDKLKTYTKSEDVKPIDIDLNNYIKLTEIEINCSQNGVDMYLINDNGLIFSRNDYTFVAFKQNNQIIWVN